MPSNILNSTMRIEKTSIQLSTSRSLILFSLLHKALGADRPFETIPFHTPDTSRLLFIFPIFHPISFLNIHINALFDGGKKIIYFLFYLHIFSVPDAASNPNQNNNTSLVEQFFKIFNLTFSCDKIYFIISDNSSQNSDFIFIRKLYCKKFTFHIYYKLHSYI